MSNRIDRIDGNKYYEYTKVKNDKVPDTDEKFSLEYKRDETQVPTKEKKEKDVPEEEKHQTLEQSGVKLELSDRGRNSAETNRKQTAGSAGTMPALDISSLLGSVQSFINTAIAAVKDFFYKLWYDSESASGNVSETAVSETSESELLKTPEEGMISDFSENSGMSEREENVPTEFKNAEAAYRMSEMRIDNEIQPYLKNGDLNQVINILTDNGNKTIARNSTLLTYYDRNGRMVEPNASDRERILNGDRNARKL